MGRKYTKKGPKYRQRDLEDALKALSTGEKITLVAKKFNVSTTTLYNEKKRREESANTGISHTKKSGRKSFLAAEVETELVSLITEMGRGGFAPSREEIPLIVQNWIKKIPEVRSVPDWEKNDQLPKKDWLLAFMRRNRMSTRRPISLGLAREEAIKDPWLIFEYYALLGHTMREMGIMDKPGQIYNCDETCFCPDPKKSKVVGLRGETTLRLTGGQSRTNTTVLATICADGTCLDPFIINKGERFQESWKGETPECPNTYYGKSESGWMKADVFEQWFETQFLVHASKERPLLLIFDGHLSHLSLRTQELARTNQIKLLKLPAHTTSTLQPLDVGIFAPLKSRWDSLMAKDQAATGGTKVSKSDFATMLIRFGV